MKQGGENEKQRGSNRTTLTLITVEAMRNPLKNASIPSKQIHHRTRKPAYCHSTLASFSNPSVGVFLAYKKLLVDLISNVKNSVMFTLEIWRIKEKKRYSHMGL